jgi:RHS repeat-associated protein
VNHDLTSETATKTVTAFGKPGKYFYLSDHLGNVRATIDETGEVLSQDAYYPFGMRMPGKSHNDGDAQARYKYNGKELDEEHGLNWLAYGARYFDPEIGRWHVVDPAEEFHSGYLYGPNNPIMGIDPDGRTWYIEIVTGALKWYNGVFEKNNLPEGFEYLGDDTYFGEESTKNINEAYINNEINEINFSVEESEQYANRYGYKLVPSQMFVFDESSKVQYFGYGRKGTSMTLVTEWHTMRSVVFESYTYTLRDNYPILHDLEHKHIGVGTNTPEFSVRQQLEWVHGSWYWRIVNKLYDLKTRPSRIGQKISYYSEYKNWKEVPEKAKFRNYK